MFKKYLNTDFKKNLALMTSSTILSQSIPILITPILTRLFTPEDFGLLALIMSIIGIGSIVINGRYEYAILLPEDDRDAFHVLFVALLVATGLSLLFMLGVFIFFHQILSVLDNESIRPWLYAIPIGTFLFGFNFALRAWWNRRKRFALLASGKIVENTTVAVSNLGFGLTKVVGQGLIISLFLGYIVSFIFYASGVIKFFFLMDKKYLSWDKTKEMARRYKKFPYLTVPSDFLGELSVHLPVFFFSAFFGPAVIGFFGLTRRVLSVPLNFVAMSLLEVFKEKATNDFRQSGNCSLIFIKTFKMLGILSLIPFIILLIWAPDIFSIIFGIEWRESGEYAQIMSFIYLFRFISCPLSCIFFIAEKQKQDLFFNFTSVVLGAISLYLGYKLWGSVQACIICYTIVYTLYYALQIIASYFFSRGKKLA